MHPLLRLIVTQPQLLADHAAAYAGLVGAELGLASAGWKRQALLYAVALCCGLLTAVLAGVAMLLWAVTPPAAIQAPWALVAVPLLPFAVTWACLVAAWMRDRAEAFANLRRQVDADLLLLREVSASS